MTFAEVLARALLGSASDAIIATDRAGMIRFWNPGAARIFGYPSDEAVGRSLDIIIPERLRRRHWEGYRRVMSGGESRYGDGAVLAVPGIRADGATVSLEFTVTLLKDSEGRTSGIVAVMRDVTRRFEEAKALAQADAAAGASRGQGKP